MSYVQVTNPTPVTSPAVAEIVYNKLWVTKLVIESPDASKKACASVTGLPWDGGANILYSGPVVVRKIPDIFGLAESHSEVGDAINAILTVVDTYGV